MPMIQTRDGVSLYAKVWGEGRPVVLIHGWPLSSDSWDPVTLALADAGFKAVAYDRRGFGRSDQPYRGYNYDTLSDDLADVMAATGADQDATIIGFSMGGGEVARYMSRHKGKGLRSAVLLSSIVPYMLKTDDNLEGVAQSQFDEMTKGMRQDRPKFMKEFLKSFFGVGVLTSPVSEPQLHWAWRLTMQAGLRPTVACAQAFATTDFREELDAFRIPTLVIHGTADQTVPIDATGRPAAEAIRDARLIEYEGAPHGLFLTHRDKLIDDLVAFLRV